MKSHESQIRNPKVKLVSDPAKVPIPAYHPDTPEVREDWSRYYDIIALADADAGQLLRELAEAGLLENTIIIYFADHRSGMARSKRTPLNSGLQGAAYFQALESGNNPAKFVKATNVKDLFT